MRERVMLYMFHHRVPLALRNLTHIVTFLDFRFGLHFLIALISVETRSVANKKAPSFSRVRPWRVFVKVKCVRS